MARPLRDAFVRNGSSATAVLLWFGGRNEHIAWTPALAGWLGPEFAVASFAYRGRSGSDGHATQAAVVEDGLHIVRWLQQEERFEGARLLLAGRSLGSAVAMQVLARLEPASRPVTGLILLSPMDSVRDLLRSNRLLAPASRWLASPFDSVAAARAVSCPVLVLLAARDTRVPHAHSWRLADAIAASRGGPPVVVETIAGTDHRTLPRSAGALQAMRSFAQEVISGARPAPQPVQPSSPQPVAWRR